jgi:DNA-binding response OmpR family regulator
MSILVIEDDASISRCVRQILSEEGFVVEAFSQADQALSWLRTHDLPSLILLDLDLDGIGGAAFRARQLCDPRLTRVPVILIGARRGAALEELGAIDFLTKPFSPEELLHVVQNRAVTLPRDEHFLRGALRQPGR